MEKDYMKKWEQPALAMLNAGATKETRDFPHYYECNACKKHFFFFLLGFDGVFDLVINVPCPRCNATDGFTWTDKSQGSAEGILGTTHNPVHQPIFGGPALPGGAVLPTGS